MYLYRMRSVLMRYKSLWKPFAFGAYLLCVLHAVVPHTHSELELEGPETCRHDNPGDWMDRLGLVFHTNLGTEHLEFFLTAERSELSALDAGIHPAPAPLLTAMVALDPAADQSLRRYGERHASTLLGQTHRAPDIGRAPPRS